MITVAHRKFQKLLITGSNGFVGSHLVHHFLNHTNWQITATSFNADHSGIENKNYQFFQMDFTNPFQVYDVIQAVQPTVVLHCGAMSKPDECEQEQWKAYIHNVEATLHLLQNAEDGKAHFIFFSTDFIFNDDKGLHKETDEPQPINYYGKTKLEAESLVQEYPFNWTIVRIVFAYGKTLWSRDSFPVAMVKKLQNGELLKIVNDQYRTPTYIGDIVGAIQSVIENNTTGIFHIAGNDICTPYDMVKLSAEIVGADTQNLMSVNHTNFTEIAKRPLKSGLNIDKIKSVLNYQPTNLIEGLKATLLPKK